MTLQAVIFDLDGVLTDTAEYHFQAWKQLADEEGLPFSRAVNEKLRGVSRRASLQLILGERVLGEERLQAMMERKNENYRRLLEQVTPADLLPGVPALLDALDNAGIPYAVASASRNAGDVIRLLGIAGRPAVIADGHSVARPKPHPDLFRYAAARLHVPPDSCLVVEDAEAGIEAAIAAGMPALALGPAERFGQLLARSERVTRRDSLEGLTIAELEAMSEPDECWVVAQQEFEPASQHHMETVFTTGNGYFASRGNLEEGYPGDSPLTLAHGIFDDVPIYFTELVNMPDWLNIELLVDGQSFRLDQGELLHFRRRLNLHQGILRREVRWKSPAGAILDISFERIISYADVQVAGLRVLVTAVNRPCHIQAHTGLNSHVTNNDLVHWRMLGQGEAEDDKVWLHVRTRHTGLDVAAAARVVATGDLSVACRDCPGQPRFTVEQRLDTAETLQIDKVISYAASRDAGPDAGDVVGRAVWHAGAHTIDGLRIAQQAAWARVWDDCDVIIEGDDDAQLAVRFNLFQLLVAAAQRDERVSIGAKTLSGHGYRGHVFWDTEIFILPFFIYTRPELARNMLMYRYHTLEGARKKASANGYMGAQYAWESAADGEEVTPTWVPDPHDRTKLIRIWTGDIQIHVSADVVYAIMQYWRVTGDDTFLRDFGAEMILDTARFWGSRAEREESDEGHRYSFRDVIGPDEYHDHVDNNSFTNHMARWNLQTALWVLEWLKMHYPAKAKALLGELDISPELLTHWQDVIDHIVFLYSPDSGLIDQFERFFELEVVSPEFIAQADRSLQVVFGIEGANERQVLKQADVILLFCLFPDHFDRRARQVNWDTYQPKTDHVFGSSLGPSIHSWAASELGFIDDAYRFFTLANRADLYDPRGNAGDGIHAASAGGVWQALVFGFAGLRPAEDGPAFQPRLPAHWQRLAFTYHYQGRRRRVEIIRTEGGLIIEET